MALFLYKGVDQTSKAKGEAPMRMDLTVTEFVELINQIRHEPESLFSMIRENVQGTVGKYLSRLMDVGLTEFLGRGRYERSEGDSNHRHGSYSRKFTLKGVAEVGVKVPRDRNGEFKTQVLPRSKQYEDALREDISVMFLASVSTRTLSLISERLIGRRIFAGEVSKVKLHPQSGWPQAAPQRGLKLGKVPLSFSLVIELYSP